MSFSPHRLVHYTPLRYPGGKQRITPYVKAIMERNKLVDGHYVEAYAGGAGVALQLLLHEYVTHIHINDISRPLHAFWNSLLNDTERLMRKISDSRVTVRAWNHHKKVYKNPDDYDEIDVGFAFLFLNRTNRSGILNGGIIGGRDQTGEWKIDARFNVRNLIARVEAVAAMRDRISVSNVDALVFLRRLLPELPAKTLIYLDPPYYVKGRQLYPDYYGDADHQAVAKFMAGVKQQRWIVSYDDHPEIRRMYSRHRGIQYELAYSARDSRSGVEVMYFSDGIDIPEGAGVLQPLAEISPEPRAMARRGVGPRHGLLAP